MTGCTISSVPASGTARDWKRRCGRSPMISSVAVAGRRRPRVENDGMLTRHSLAAVSRTCCRAAFRNGSALSGGTCADCGGATTRPGIWENEMGPILTGCRGGAVATRRVHALKYTAGGRSVVSQADVEV